MNEQTVYAQIGAEAIRQLVDDFYARIEQDPELRPLFPEELEQGKEHQYLFLVQYFGGPGDYSQQRGHPRLKLRHAPFPIGLRQSELWLGHMLAAIDAVGIAEPARTTMHEYFKRAAPSMVNQFESEYPASKVISKL
jgi:hemoglobin